VSEDAFQALNPLREPAWPSRWVALRPPRSCRHYFQHPAFPVTRFEVHPTYDPGTANATISWNCEPMRNHLLLKSGFLPKLLRILLVLGCLGYMDNVFGELLVPHYTDTLVSNYAGLPAAIGEIGTCPGCCWCTAAEQRRRITIGSSQIGCGSA
jgi:uncharacterized protein DUF4386